MDNYEKVAYSLFGVLLAVYAATVIFGIVTLWPVGVVGLIFLIGMGALLIKVLRERLRNKEDSHYDREVDQ